MSPALVSDLLIMGVMPICSHPGLKSLSGGVEPWPLLYDCRVDVPRYMNRPLSVDVSSSLSSLSLLIDRPAFDNVNGCDIPDCIACRAASLIKRKRYSPITLLSCYFSEKNGMNKIWPKTVGSGILLG